MKKSLILFAVLAMLLVLLILRNWAWIGNNSAGIQAISTAILVLITVSYALSSSQMAEAMEKARKGQERLLKIKADIVTALFQWGGGKHVREIAEGTGHTEEEIKTVLPDLLGPNGPVVCCGFRDGVLHFRVKTEWDMDSPTQRQKVKADFVSTLLEGGPKNLAEIAGITGHSIETLKYNLPDLLDPCGPVVFSGTDGGYRYRLKTESAPGG